MDNLPPEVLSNISQWLTFEDSLSLSATCRKVRQACRRRLHVYSKMEISDDAKDCRLIDPRGRTPPLHFHPGSSAQLLSLTSSIQEINIMMKEVDLRTAMQQQFWSPFARGGYLAPLLFHNVHALQSLKQISLHVDMMVDNIKDQNVACPTEDLAFAIQQLAQTNIQTFIQISICCIEYSDQDAPNRNRLITEMQDVLKKANEMGAKTEFDVEPPEGYVDITIEKDNLEYTFAFFYYNPEICQTNSELPVKSAITEENLP